MFWPITLKKCQTCHLHMQTKPKYQHCTFCALHCVGRHQMKLVRMRNLIPRGISNTQFNLTWENSKSILENDMIFSSFKIRQLIFMKLSVLHLGVKISNINWFINLHIDLRGPLRPNILITFPTLKIMEGTIFRQYNRNEKFFSDLLVVDLSDLDDLRGH